MRSSLFVLILLSASPALAQPALWGMPVMTGPVTAQMATVDVSSSLPELATAMPVTMPYLLTDGHSMSWDIQYDGTAGDGTNDAFDGAMLLTVDGATASHDGTGRVLEGGREVVVGPAPVGYGLMLVRRVRVLDDGDHARWVDVLINPGAEMVRTSITYSIALGSDDGTILAATTSGDTVPGLDDHGWVTDDQSPDGNDPAVAVVFRSDDVELTPSLNLATSGDDTPLLTFPVEIPAGQAVALAVFIAQYHHRADAVEWMNSFEPGAQIADIDVPVVNVRPGGRSGPHVAGLMRGTDQRDVVELTTGDRLEGSLLVDGLSITTWYGAYTFKSREIAGVVLGQAGAGDDVLVLQRGEVLVGDVGADPVQLKLPSGRKITLNRESMARIGLRLSDDGAAVQATDDVALLRRGDQLHGKIVTESLRLATPYGVVELPMQRVAGIDLGVRDRSLHRVSLSDGSTLSGIVLDPVVQFRHRGGLLLDLDQSRLGGLQVPGLLIEPAVDPHAPQILLANGDRWSGRPAGGTITVVAPFGDQQLSMDDIDTLQLTDPAAGRVTVVLRDGGSFSGRLAAERLTMELSCGLSIDVPVTHLASLRVPPPSDAGTSGRRLPIQLH